MVNLSVFYFEALFLKPVFKFLFMIYTIGEIVLDVICHDFDHIIAKPGGSMLNTAISLGRLNLPVEHISYVADDKNGKLIKKFLSENGVRTNFLHVSPTNKTNLAFAHLDEERNASYTFYKEDLQDYHKLTLPQICRHDIILFGSFFSINPKIRAVLVPFIEKARKNGALIIYDPNFREPHKPMLAILKQHIEKNMQLAHIIKGSDEDFYQVFGFNNSQEAWELVKTYGVKSLIYTKGKKGAELFYHNQHLQVEAKPVEVLSTIGAGDTYNAGIIYGLVKDHLPEMVMLNKPVKWQPILETASEFAAHVCGSYDNYLSKEYINQMHV